MFGHQDDQQEEQPTIVTSDAPAPEDQSTAPVVADDAFNPALPTASSAADDADDVTSATDSASPAADDAPTEPSPTTVFDPASFSSRADGKTTAESDDALLDIKQQALTQLTPLVDQLDQTPEEKFRTTMMMIQAADNKALVPKAYEAAEAITDEKVKAQALLDIVNEINYFTQHPA